MVQTFVPQGEARVWGHPPNCMALDWGRFYGTSMSQLFLPVLMWIFSKFQYIGITQVISAFFPYIMCNCSMYVTSPWEGGI